MQYFFFVWEEGVLRNYDKKRRVQNESYSTLKSMNINIIPNVNFQQYDWSNGRVTILNVTLLSM